MASDTPSRDRDDIESGESTIEISDPDDSKSEGDDGLEIEIEAELPDSDRYPDPEPGPPRLATPIEAQPEGEIDDLGSQDVEVLADDDVEMLDDDELVEVRPPRAATQIAAIPPPPIPRPPPIPPGGARREEPAAARPIDGQSEEAAAPGRSPAEEGDGSAEREASGAPEDSAARPGAAGGGARFEETLDAFGDLTLDESGSGPDGRSSRPDTGRPPELRGLELPTVIERLEGEGGDPAARVRELELELEGTLEPERVAAFRYELGELASRGLRDAQRAESEHRASRDAEPGLRANLWALKRLYRAAERWEDVAEICATEALYAISDAERADLLAERGEILEDRLDRAADARAAYEEAVTCDSRCVAALIGLERAADRDGDADARERVLRDQAEAAADPRRRALFLIELARLRLDSGELGAGDALAILSEAADLQVFSQRVGQLRERAGELCEDWEAVLAGLEQQIADWLARFGPAGPPLHDPTPAGERPGAAEQARATVVALRRRQARIARQQLADPQRAWDYLEQALVLMPSEPLLLSDLADLAEKLGKYQELAELCAGWESQEADPVRSLSLSIRRAEALLHGDQLQAAGRLLASLSATAPGYLPITALLERDAIARLDWRALASTFGQMGDAAAIGGAFAPGTGAHLDKKGAAGLYTAAGDLMASPAIEDLDQARHYYGRALELEAGFPPAVEALVELYQRHGMFEDACQLLELQSEIDDASRRLDYLHRLARMYQELGQFEDQAGVLERITALRPEDMSSRHRLEELYGDLGLFEKRAEVLLGIADAELDPRRQAALLIEVARVRELDLKDLEGATELYGRVVKLDPEDGFARDALAAVLRRRGEWAELVQALRGHAQVAADGPKLVRLLREAAEIQRVELGDPRAAADIYRELCDRMPGEESALAGLADALAEAGDEGELAVLEQLAEMRSDRAAQAATLTRLAQRYEELERHGEAEGVYRRIAEAVPDSPFGGVAVALAARRSGAPALFAEALEELRDHRADPVLRSQLSEHAGFTWLLELGDLERADAAFLAAAEAAPTRPGPRLGLALTRSRMDAAMAHAEALVDLAHTAGGGYTGGALMVRAATTALVEGETQQAWRWASQARAAAPDDAGALMVSAELAAPLLDRDEGSAEALAERGESLAARAALAEAESVRDGFELDAADQLERAGRLREAADLIAGVLASRPDDLRALRALRTVCRRAGDRRGYASATVALARILGDGHAKIELWREAAAVFDGELGDVHAAVPVYQRILQVDPDADEYQRLHQLYSEAGDHSGLYEILSARIHRAELHGSPTSERVALHLERASVREALGDVKGACRDLRELLALDPRHVVALERQGRLLIRLGRAEEASRNLERYLEVEDDPVKRGEAEITLSQLLAESLEDYTGAIVQLEHVLQSGGDDEVRDRLITYLLASERWDRAIAELEKAADSRSRPAARARDYLRMAEIHRDHRRDPRAAQAALERARQAAPLNIDIIRELAELVGGSADVRLRNRVLRSGCRDLRSALREQPGRARLYERLAAVNRWLGETEGRFFALQCFGALQSLESSQRSFVGETRAALGPLPETLGDPISDDEYRSRIAHPGFGGVASELWSILGGAVDALRTAGPDAFGFTRGDRTSSRALAGKYPRAHAALAAVGVSGSEVYVSTAKRNTARVIGHGKPKILLSADIAGGETPHARFHLGRAAAQARDRSGILPHLSDEEIRLYFAAAIKLCGLQRLPTSVDEVLGEGGDSSDALERYIRQLGKQLGRGERKTLAQSIAGLASLPDPAIWKSAGNVTSARVGLLLAGDLDAALDILDVGRGGRSLMDEPAALELLVWAASADHLLLRARLGLREMPEQTGTNT